MVDKNRSPRSRGDLPELTPFEEFSIITALAGMTMHTGLPCLPLHLQLPLEGFRDGDLVRIF